MAQIVTILECWQKCAEQLLEQSLEGNPKFTLVAGDARPLPGIAFTASIEGELQGSFTLLVEASVAEDPTLFGQQGAESDAIALWQEVLKGTVEAAIGEMHHRTGRQIRLTGFSREEQAPVPVKSSWKQFDLRLELRSLSLYVLDQTVEVKATLSAASEPTASRPAPISSQQTVPNQTTTSVPNQGARNESLPARGVELLLDVQLEASLRFGAREMQLSEILELGPGDVVQLDRHITDPVDLIVGDKIVARGEVVLVNGNFGLRVASVAEPQKRLENIRCLF